MEIIRVKTQRGLELKGAMFGSYSMDTVVILMSGICSNVFQNNLLAFTGELLCKNNIACIIGHAMDAFSCIAYSDFSTGKQRNTGVIFDEFDKVYEDVESYVKYAKNKGFKKIILAGHSLGSNKIIHYLGKTSDNFADYFIASSPIDLSHWFNVMPNVKQCLQTAKAFYKEKRENDILPHLFGGFSPISAKSALEFYNADNLKNCPVISNDGETESLNNIKIKGTFLIGSKDSLTDGDAESFLRKINSYCKFPQDNHIIVIDNATHIFYGMHQKYAETVLDIVKLT